MSELVKDTFSKIIESAQKDAAVTEGIFKVTSTLDEHVRVINRTREFEFIADEPAALAGTNQGPNPIEYLLGSLGACQVITYSAIASLKGIQLDKVTVHTKGKIDWQNFLGISKDTRPGYQVIEVEAVIESEEPEEVLQELIKEVEARCPILDNLSNNTKIIGKATIKKKKELAA